MSAIRSRTATLALLAAAAGLLAAGCASSDAAEPATSAAEAVTTTTAAAHDHPVVAVTAVDFAFKGLPKRIRANTRLTLANDAASELHELVAIHLPEDEKRSVEELLRLPEEELGKLLGAAPPATVLLTPPKGEQVPAVGDGTLSEPGRYLVMCSIPTGVAPADYLAAAAASNGAPPQVPGGPPHFVHGMATELIVE